MSNILNYNHKIKQYNYSDAPRPKVGASFENKEDYFFMAWISD